MASAHVAIDLGASSGRAIVGLLDDTANNIELTELHRFEHLPLDTPTGPVWDWTGIWHHVLAGLRAAAAWQKRHHMKIASVGVDTWGVDWSLVAPSGELLMLPHCYRDPANEAAAEQVVQRLGGFDKLYARTGIQRMPFNTVFQIYHRHQRDAPLFAAAGQMMFLADLLHFWLSGTRSIERTMASTSSLLDVTTGQWDHELVAKLGLPAHIFGEIVDAGTSLGTLRAEVAAATGLDAAVKVIAPATHDTASAVAAVPANSASGHWAYLSSGTWSLLGAELTSPSATAETQQIPFTNERGVDDTIRLLKNIGGLWLVQQVRADLNASGEQHEFADLVDAAAGCECYRTLINPNDGVFATPGGMIERIQKAASESGQPVPHSPGELVRCCLDSLALCYAETLDKLEQVTGQAVDTLHIVGGGAQNDLLNKLTASCIGRRVVTGPVEATAIGNLLVQARGCGRIESLAHLREVVAESFPTTSVDPEDALRPSDEVRARFARVVGG
jgi:rhamnulokinase